MELLDSWNERYVQVTVGHVVVWPQVRLVSEVGSAPLMIYISVGLDVKCKKEARARTGAVSASIQVSPLDVNCMFAVNATPVTVF